MFSITVTEKGGEQRRLDFDKPEITIGRVQGNDVILPKGNVSKRHARIVQARRPPLSANPIPSEPLHAIKRTNGRI